MDLSKLNPIRLKLGQGDPLSDDELQYLTDVYPEAEVICEILLNEGWKSPNQPSNVYELMRDYLDRYKDKTLSDTEKIGYYYTNLLSAIVGINSFNMADFNESLQYFMQVQINEFTVFPMSFLALSLQMSGFVFQALDLHRLELLMDRYLEFTVKYDQFAYFPNLRIMAYSNCAEMYLAFGYFEKSKHYIELTDNIISKTTSNPHDTILTYYIVKGKYFLEISNLEKAEEFFLKAYHYEFSPPYMSVQTHSILLIFYYNLGNDKFYEIAEKIENIEDDLYKPLQEITHAMKLIKQKRRRSKTKAEELCQSILNNPKAWAQIKEMSITLLISLLIEEYENEGENEIIDEIYSYMNQLDELSQGNLSRKKIQSKIIHSKIHLIQMHIDESLEILNTLQTQLEHSDYKGYLPHVKKEISDTEDIITQWGKLGKVNQSIRKRVEQTRIKRYIEDALNYIN